MKKINFKNILKKTFKNKKKLKKQIVKKKTKKKDPLIIKKKLSGINNIELITLF